MARKPRAVAYLRQSTYREESISLELQETACREHARREGYEVVAVEADPGISGRTFDRPAVQRVMGMVDDGAVDVIILWKWSRLSRSRKDWAVAADAVERAGGRIESATEAIDTSTSTGRLARGVMVEFAAFESERIGDVWREAHARRVAGGRPANGKARFGYTYDREQKLHVPDPVTGPILAQLYRRYLDGESFYALVRWLRERGVAPAAGYSVQTGDWSDRTLRRVLDSGFAAGYIRSRGELLPGVHEPLIDEHEWARYLRRREERAVHRRTERSEYLLSGLVHCACGGTMQAGQHTRTGQRLRCRAAAEYGAHKGGYIQAHFVEAAIRETLTDLAAEVSERAGDAQPAPARAGAALAQLEKEQEKILSSLTRLAMRLVDETISLDVHERARREYDDRLTRITRELDDERARLADPAPTRKVLHDLARDWDFLPVAQLRETLGQVLQSVIVTPGDRIIAVSPRTGARREFRP